MGVAPIMLGLLARKSGQLPQGSTKPVLFVTVFGLAADAYAEILQVVQAKFDRRFRIVFCLAGDDFSIFVQRGVVCEAFPSLEDQGKHSDLLDWSAYLAAKWALIIDKWKPAKILSYGMNFDSYIDASKAAARQSSAP